MAVVDWEGGVVREEVRCCCWDSAAVTGGEVPHLSISSLVDVVVAAAAAVVVAAAADLGGKYFVEGAG